MGGPTAKRIHTKVFPPAVEAYLLKKETMLDMQLMNINDRCAIIRKKFKFSVCNPTLTKFYRRSKMSYMNVKTQSAACYHNPERTLAARTSFLTKLTYLMDSKLPICFLDETTFVLTSMPKKLW